MIFMFLQNLRKFRYIKQPILYKAILCVNLIWLLKRINLSGAPLMTTWKKESSGEWVDPNSQFIVLIKKFLFDWKTIAFWMVIIIIWFFICLYHFFLNGGGNLPKTMKTFLKLITRTTMARYFDTNKLLY